MASMTSQLDTLLHRAAFALRDARAFLRVTGAAPTRWLNGMVTNSVAALAPGEGNYNFLLNAQGRIQGDALLFRETRAAGNAEYLLETGAPQIEAIQTHLDRFIIMDDVELTPAFADESTLRLLGPEAPQHLAALDLPALDPLHLAHADTPHGPVLLSAPPEGTVPCFDLRASAATLTALRERLIGRSVAETTAAALEQLRVFAGIPRFGVDIGDRELPQETNQTHALHFSKGCYLGQEIVERIRSRGQVHRIFSAFRLEGSLPSVPAILEAHGKTVGELTSAAEVAMEGGTSLLGLGYLRREVLEKQATLTYAGGTAILRSLPHRGIAAAGRESAA